MSVISRRWNCPLFGYEISLLDWLGDRFPWDTLVVNSIGSFLLGALLGSDIASGGIMSFLLLGFCGGLTTFSTFSFQTFSLVSKRAWYKALSNMILSVVPAYCVYCVVMLLGVTIK